MRWPLVLFVLIAAACDGKQPCDDVPCSEGRVCVVKGTDKVACEVPDAGTP
jgi:hypothetical protein